MINCPKCNSENIKRTGPFNREKLEGQRHQSQGEQMLNYRCLNCENEWQVKFSEEST